MKVTRLTYQNKFSGIKVVPDAPVQIPKDRSKLSHMQRAFYLTAALEAPVWGCVQSYDGCGMSGGPFHFVAVLPKTMTQGPLFSLLRRIEITPGAPTQPLWDALKAVGWYVSMDGKLRDYKTGSIIPGKAIRDTFSPVNGVVPASGSARKTAENWAVLFGKLLSDSRTFDAQIDHSIEYLVKGCSAVELQAYQLFIPKLKSPEAIGKDPTTTIPEAVDLAMCVYHAYSPNAPAIAQQVLKAVIAKVGPKPDPLQFAKVLIKTLGTKKYGRWADIPGTKGSRHDWTRNAAIKSGLWSKDLLDKTMPQDF